MRQTNNLFPSKLNIKGRAEMHALLVIHNRSISRQNIPPIEATPQVQHLDFRVVISKSIRRGFSLETSKARQAYRDFFALWKDADADLPVLMEAKKEYEKLK